VALPRPRARASTTMAEFMLIKERCLDLLRNEAAAPIEDAA
jgi:hypothetical protein